MIGKAIRSRAMARAGVVGLFLGVAALAGLAGYSISSNAETTRHVRTTSLQSDQWAQLTLNVSTEYEALSDYLRATTDVAREPFLSAIGSAAGNLAWLARAGDETDMEEASEVGDAYSAYTDTLHELVEAGQKRDRATVEQLAGQAGMAASTLRKTALTQVSRKRLETDQYLTAVDLRNQRLLLVAGVVVGLDLLLLGLCGLVLLTHQRRMERQAQENHYRAGHDGLTGLANRSLFTEDLEKAVARADRDREPVGLLLLDLDKFKEVNDTLGHHVGDLLLIEVAERLSGAVRESDTVARLGGDEFAVLLPRVGSAAGCLTLAEKLLDAVRGPADLDGHRVEISGSIGAAVHPGPGANQSDLLQHADLAMYTAKRTRSGTALYQPECLPHAA